jgi:putative Mn2+ efflux pump MntP
MGFAELMLIALGLSMDAFAVAVCRGLHMRRINYRHAAVIALFFGGFQALMPLAGFLLGSAFERYIDGFDHWLAFMLLGFIGGKMIYEATRKDEGNGEHDDDSLNIKELFMLAVATSIDALAVGITLAVIPGMNIGTSILLIGATTFVISLVGVVLGNRFGSRYKGKAELAGGVVLVLIGLKILLEHLGVISF